MRNITASEFDKVINGEKIVIVDFWASWCGPCKMLAPVLEKVSETLTDYDFVKVDVDAEQELAIKNQIYSIPTLVMYKAGKEIVRKSGYMNESELTNFILNSTK